MSAPIAAAEVWTAVVRSLLINTGIAAGSLFAGAGFFLVLRVVGMPVVVIAVSAVGVGVAVVLLAYLAARGRGR